MVHVRTYAGTSAVTHAIEIADEFNKQCDDDAVDNDDVVILLLQLTFTL